jgi:hypothetical protein
MVQLSQYARNARERWAGKRTNTQDGGAEQWPVRSGGRCESALHAKRLRRQSRDTLWALSFRLKQQISLNSENIQNRGFNQE